MSPVPLISENFADVLDVRFRDIAPGTYDKGKSMIPVLFTVKDSDRSEEKYSALTPMGEFEEFTDAVALSGAYQEYDVTSTHIEFALATQIRRALYDDDQFGVIDEQFAELGNSAFKTHENDAADVFRGAFSNPSDFYVHTEGVALCSNSHTTPVENVSTATGFDNLTTGELNPANLTAALIQARLFSDAAGDPIGDFQNLELLVSVQNADRAQEIIKTTKGLDTEEGNINVHESRFKVIDWYRLGTSKDWFLMDADRRKKNLIWFWRVPLELAKMEQFENIIAKGRGYMRYSYLRRDWRFIIGADVT